MPDEVSQSQLEPTTPRSVAGLPLTEEDFRHLELSSWIDRETARGAALTRVNSAVGAELLGRDDGEKRNYAGIVFSYFLPGQTHPHSYRIRRDRPEYRKAKGDRVKEVGKYLAPPGTRNRLYFPPRTRPEDLLNVDVPLIIAEGEKKALSLDRLAHFKTERARFVAVGIPGVWGFSGVVGKDSDQQGRRVDVRGVIADLDLIRWPSRMVALAFDVDVRTNPKVMHARSQLARIVAERGARERTIDIPEDSGRKGIDELLAIWGPTRVLDLIEAAFHAEKRVLSQYCRDHRSLWRITESRDAPSRIQLTNFEAQVVAEIVEDDGLEQQRFLELECFDQHNKRHLFTLSPQDFTGMNWPIEKIGSVAIVLPNQREHTRAAIQSLSEQPRRKLIFKHIGWAHIGDQWVYLNASGAISGSGNVPEIGIKLEGALQNYQLQLPTGSDRIKSVRASLALLDLAPNAMYALVSAVYRSVLKACDFTIHLVGPSGVYKTAVSALLQQHFGASMNERNLPGSWSSTANALETLAFQAKDALVVVDDYAPKGSLQDVSNLNATAERVIRAVGNHSARQRLSSDGVLKYGKPPRGLLLSTGEDVPAGHSVRARLLTIQIGRGDVDTTLLTKVQQYGSDGMLATCLGGFVQWIAREYSERLRQFEHSFARLRSEFLGGGHARNPGIVADLQIGFETFLAYALVLLCYKRSAQQNGQ